MTKYGVLLELSGSAYVVIEAENEDKAEELARELAEDAWADVDFEKEIGDLISFRERVARILKQPVTDCDDLLVLGLGSRICRIKRQAARINELEAALRQLSEEHPEAFR